MAGASEFLAGIKRMLRNINYTAERSLECHEIDNLDVQAREMLRDALEKKPMMIEEDREVRHRLRDLNEALSRGRELVRACRHKDDNYFKIRCLNTPEQQFNELRQAKEDISQKLALTTSAIRAHRPRKHGRREPQAQRDPLHQRQEQHGAQGHVHRRHEPRGQQGHARRSHEPQGQQGRTHQRHEPQAQQGARHERHEPQGQRQGPEYRRRDAQQAAPHQRHMPHGQHGPTNQRREPHGQQAPMHRGHEAHRQEPGAHQRNHARRQQDPASRRP